MDREDYRQGRVVQQQGKHLIQWPIGKQAFVETGRRQQEQPVKLGVEDQDESAVLGSTKGDRGPARLSLNVRQSA
jgi:hypothetical protein